MKQLGQNVKTNTDEPVFSQASFLSSKSKYYGWFDIEGEKIPYIIDKRLIFKRLIITNFGVKGNENDIFMKIFDKVKDLDVDVVKLQNNVILPEIINSAICYEYGTHRLSLEKDTEELFAGFKTNCKRKIKKAIKIGIEIRPVSVEIAYKIINEMFNRQGQFAFGPSKEYLSRLKNNLCDNLLLLGAFKGGAVQTVIVVPYDSQVGYYLYGGSIEGSQAGCMDLLFFEVFKRLQQIGIKHFDFMGARVNPAPNSKQAGLKRFKEMFSPELIEGYSLMYIVKPFKYRLFKISVSIYYLLKGGRFQDDSPDQVTAKKKEAG